MEAWYLSALKIWLQKKKSPPTVERFALWLGKSRTAAHSALMALEHKGWVRRASDKDRRFVPVEGL
jgi:DNA-binding IclR family transcriptional regulator